MAPKLKTKRPLDKIDSRGSFMRFLDPTNDYAFKRIFSNENRKEILISFLNGILSLEGSETITEIKLLNPSQAPHIKGSKETIVDVRCHDQSGAEYIVEMQVLMQEDFDKRVLYYASKAYANQLDKAEAYKLLKPVIFLGILNFGFTNNHRHVSTHRIYELETQEHCFQDFQFTLVELPKFSKTEDELVTLSDKWVYFLKHAKELEAVPEVFHERAIQEAFEIMNQCNWSKGDLAVYDRQAMARRDEAARQLWGMNEGHRQGVKKGRKEGRNQHAIAVVKELAERGFSDEEIVAIAKIKPEELEEFKKTDVTEE